MRRTEVVLIDYGMGNLLSVQRGLEYVGAEVCVSAEPSRILAADRVVLPGVGAFPDAMDELRRRELVPVIQALAVRGVPLLGICLGMQVLFDAGFEYSETAGLGLLPGRIVPIPTRCADGRPKKIPHIGWNELYPVGQASWRDSVLSDLEPGDSAYFVHSFMAQPSDARCRIADCNYGGTAIAAVVGSGKVVGCQFHPEKSGDVGLRILRRFLSL